MKIRCTINDWSPDLKIGDWVETRSLPDEFKNYGERDLGKIFQLTNRINYVNKEEFYSKKKVHNLQLQE